MVRTRLKSRRGGLSKPKRRWKCPQILLHTAKRGTVSILASHLLGVLGVLGESGNPQMIRIIPKASNKASWGDERSTLVMGYMGYSVVGKMHVLTTYRKPNDYVLYSTVVRRHRHTGRQVSQNRLDQHSMYLYDYHQYIFHNGSR